VAAPRKSIARTRPAKITREVSAMGWIEDRHGAVLMVRQKRARKLWTLPGGKIEAKESVEAGLKREIAEETGMRVTFASFVAIFDRPERANITFLYRARLNEADRPKPQAAEIATIQYRTRLPAQASPSLRFFWRMLRGKSAG